MYQWFSVFRLFLGPVFAPPWLNLKLTKIKAMLFLQCHCCMLTNQKIKRIWKKMLDDIKMVVGLKVGIGFEL